MHAPPPQENCQERILRNNSEISAVTVNLHHSNSLPHHLSVPLMSPLKMKGI